MSRKCQVIDAPLLAGTIRIPQIDGATDDTAWASSPWLRVATVVEGTIANNENDLRAQFNTLWTDSHLFIALDVVDNEVVNNSSDPLLDDALVIAIDPNNSRGPTADGVDDVRYVFGVDEDGFSERNLNRVQGVEFAFRRTARGYGFEAQIPWTTLSLTPSQGGRIGFQVAVVDDDAANPLAVVMWSGTMRAAETTPALYGTFILGAPP